MAAHGPIWEHGAADGAGLLRALVAILRDAARAEGAFVVVPEPLGMLDGGGEAQIDQLMSTVLEERQLRKECARVSKRFVYIEVPCELHLRTTTKTVQRLLLQIGHINAYTPVSFALPLVSSGLHIERMIARDVSLESHLFAPSGLKDQVASFIRKSLLKFNGTLACRLFAVHVGALRHK